MCRFKKVIKLTKLSLENLKKNKSNDQRILKWTFNVAHGCWCHVKVPLKQIINHQAQSIKCWPQDHSWQNQQLWKIRHLRKVTFSRNQRQNLIRNLIIMLEQLGAEGIPVLKTLITHIVILWLNPDQRQIRSVEIILTQNSWGCTVFKKTRQSSVNNQINSNSNFNWLSELQRAWCMDLFYQRLKNKQESIWGSWHMRSMIMKEGTLSSDMLLKWLMTMQMKKIGLLLYNFSQAWVRSLVSSCVNNLSDWNCYRWDKTPALK